MLYNGLFKSKSAPPIASSVSLGTQTAPGAYGSEADPLPFGDNLSGELKKVLLRNGLQFGAFAYPKLQQNEVGISTSDLVKPQSNSEN